MDLVGRARELAALDAVLARAATGARQLVLVAGEPGIGKTSLVEAFRGAAVATGATWLSGAAWEDGAPSYWPWMQVVRAAERSAPEEVRRRAGALGPLAPGGSDAAVDRFVLHDAVAELVLAVAGSGPVVVALEDLHAAGPSTAELLEDVCRATAGAPVVLVATYRPAEVAAAPGLRDVVARLEGTGTVLDPRPFGETEVVAVLTAHGLTADPALVAAVLERTQGNPLFVVHTARELAAGGSAAETGLPLGLRNALRRQAALAGHGADGVLEAAAVLGEELTAATLAATTGREPAEVQATLDRAVGLRLLRRDPVGRYVFTHALVREAVYDGLPSARAAETHLRAAHALVAAGAGPDRLAWHFGAAWPAGGAAEAARYARLAGDDATRASAHGEAAAAYLLALTAHDRLPEPDPVARAGLLLALAGARLRAGRTEEGHRIVAQALGLARTLGDADLFARAALLTATGLAFNAVQLEAIDVLREADAMFGDAIGDPHAAVVARLAELVAVEDRAEALRLAVRAGELAPDLPAALAARLEVEWGRHDPRDALERAQRLAALVTEAPAVARAATWVMVFALELGDVATAAAAVTTLQHAADRSRQPALAHLAASRRATIATVRGDAVSARAAVREARDLATRFGLADGEAVAWGQLFTLARITDLTSEERAAMERTARELAATSPYPIAHDGAVVQMLLAEGREAEARELFRRLMGLLDELDHDLLRTWSLALLAEDAVALGEEEAAARIHDALLPYAGRFVVAAGGVACLGAVSDHLRLLAAMGRRAVAMESADGIVTLRLGADVVRLPGSLGLTHLAVLLANPGSDVPATRLAVPAGGDVPREGGADEVLDRRALAAYRSRLAEIDEELEEARGWSDDGRVGLLEDERDALLAELRGDLGLGGRPRRFADEAERARVNVTRAIRSAIRRVGERAPAIGEHLERSVSTGARCRYDPAAASVQNAATASTIWSRPGCSSG